MIELDFRIFIDEVFHRDFDSWYAGDNCGRMVKFIYHNAVTNKDKFNLLLNFHDAVQLARRMQADGRYNDFEFLIKVP